MWDPPRSGLEPVSLALAGGFLTTVPPGKSQNPWFFKDTCTPVFIAALFTIARSWKQPKCPSTDEWIKKMWYIYIMEYYSAIKRNEIRSFVNMWMDLETVMQSKSEREKQQANGHLIYSTSKISDHAAGMCSHLIFHFSL